MPTVAAVPGMIAMFRGGSRFARASMLMMGRLVSFNLRGFPVIRMFIGR